MRALIATAVLMTLVATTAAARTPFPPADEADRDPSFLAFRAELADIAMRKDAQALLAHVDPAIRYTFGVDNGLEGFIETWGLERDPANSELWGELLEVLNLGGTFQEESFVAPYVFSTWPDELDAFEHVAVTGSNVRVRAEPSLTAPVVGAASYEILRIGENAFSNPDWIAVFLDDGRAGHVSADYARSPIDYRAYFGKVDGAWKMQLFIAGD